MKLSEVYEIANELAPKKLSDELCQKYGFYDNSGVLVDAGEEITGIVCSLDFSKGAIEKAVEIGANLILTHHPAIYGSISAIQAEDKGLGEKLVRCLRKGISVLSMHLNLDACKEGIDESLREGICRAAKSKAFQGEVVQYPLVEGGYGRAYGISSIAFGELAENLQAEFSTDRVVAYGEKNRKIERVASFCGAGADEKSVAFALLQGADVIISSDFKHHLLSMALEGGMSVITLTHYAAEAYGFEKYYKKISQRVSVPCVYHADTNLR